MGKLLYVFFQNELVFKLPKEIHGDALSSEGSQLFDPSGKKRPMKEWVQVPKDYTDFWVKYAKSAIKYVGGK